MAYASRLLLISSLLFSAGAEAKCPDRLDGASAAWGGPTATSYNDPLFEPKGLRMLGRNVSYVTVTQDGFAVEMRFRLAGEVRRSGAPLSQSIRDAFAESYSDIECSQLKATCGAFDSFRDGPGYLTDVVLQDDSAPGSNWQGAGARLIAADQKLSEQGSGPVYLICRYAK